MHPRPEVRRRVAVTGVGAYCSLGRNAGELLEAVRQGRSGARPMTWPGVDWGVGVACTLPGEGLAPRPKSARALRAGGDVVTALALAAVSEALRDAGLEGPAAAARPGAAGGVGLILGTSQGRTHVIADMLAAAGGAPGGLDSVPQAAICRDLAAAVPVFSWGFTVATACAAGSDAIGLGAHRVRSGAAECVVCGGVDVITPLLFTGFAALRAMSATACRPFSRDRDGIVIGEGAAFVVLEPLAAARRRGARVHAEIIGYGSSNDGYHITYPDPSGRAAERAVRECLADAGLLAGTVDYVNAHGTGTRANDEIEIQVLRRVFGRRLRAVPISSSKSMAGHAMGAAGAIEAVITVLALEHRFFPPTINFSAPMAGGEDLDYVPNQGRPGAPRVALSTSFGFGGVNACLAVGRTGEEGGAA